MVTIDSGVVFDFPATWERFTEGEDIAPSMPSLFDLSQATPGRLPPIDRPRTAVELLAMTNAYTARMLECISAAEHLRTGATGHPRQRVQRRHVV